MNKEITIRDLYQRVLNGKNIIQEIVYNDEVYEFNEEENFYRHYNDYGSYWLPFNLDEFVEIISVSVNDTKYSFGEEDNNKIEKMKIDEVEDAEHLKFKEKINEIIDKINNME